MNGAVVFWGSCCSLLDLQDALDSLARRHDGGGEEAGKTSGYGKLHGSEFLT